MVSRCSRLEIVRTYERMRGESGLIEEEKADTTETNNQRNKDAGRAPCELNTTPGECDGDGGRTSDDEEIATERTPSVSITELCASVRSLHPIHLTKLLSNSPLRGSELHADEDEQRGDTRNGQIQIYGSKYG